jgi:hypothetical protein
MLGVALLVVLLILQQQQWVHLPGSGPLWPAVAAYRIEHFRDSIAPDLVRFDSPYVWKFVGGTSAMSLAPAPAGWSITGRC